MISVYEGSLQSQATYIKVGGDSRVSLSNSCRGTSTATVEYYDGSLGFLTIPVSTSI